MRKFAILFNIVFFYKKNANIGDRIIVKGLYEKCIKEEYCDDPYG